MVNPDRRNRWFAFIVPALSVLVALLLAEGLLALVHPAPFAAEHTMYFEDDPHTGYRLKPGSVGRFHSGISTRVNAQGLRDDLVSLRKPKGVYRILVLGDSFAMGTNVRQSEAFPQLLEQQLNTARGYRIEVVNSGVGGWAPFHYAEFFLNRGVAYDPDLVLVGFYVGNDTYNQTRELSDTQTTVQGRRVSRGSELSLLAGLRVAAYNHSHLARHILAPAPRKGWSPGRQDCADFSDFYLDLQRRKLENHRPWTMERASLAANAGFQLSRIKRRADELGIPVIVALFPDESQLNPALQSRLATEAELVDYAFTMPQAMLKAQFAEAGLSVVDLLPALQGDRRCLYMNETHWNAKGHALVADVLSKLLLKQLPR